MMLDILILSYFIIGFVLFIHLRHTRKKYEIDAITWLVVTILVLPYALAYNLLHMDEAED